MDSYLRLRETLTLFEPLTDAAWADMQSLFQPGSLKRGDYFVREGAYNYKVGFILDGALRAYYLDEDGNFYNKTFFVANTFAASLASILQRIPSYLNFDALLDTKFLEASYLDIEALFPKHRCLETCVRKLVEYEWVIKKERRELRLVLNDATQRYLYFREEYPGLENQIPQYHIASHLGITPIQLSRIRSRIKA
ncbi:Crp/Fnr family transcriptional regulator [Flavilitoribacter nigricans]|uniref:Cyclic nucleotide-binding protein n=1 Tax=Flavilitoribacter nigricans (strain ATCC 23147 / DSM 23189 / NBRC 102662 / NCIMB 1420 / SS-2) TaxID=1122177 RepID=A0A2D0NIM1_FLAN2|nr:Crp/Fnr family transcriptional regulator [Flavilitoribacter nigricans]PHN07603.1 cyclic nucleotide-binding protein [Flavilitoribacter nigricans DSM 23189 = NBRC 102662]